jgi:hypothetical protein
MNSSRPLAETLSQTAKEINQSTPSPKPPGEQPRFVVLSEQLAESILEAAKMQLVAAENNLEEAKRYSEKLLQDVRKRAEELIDLTSRVENFGQSVLDAHKKFHNGEAK